LVEDWGAVRRPFFVWMKEAFVKNNEMITFATTVVVCMEILNAIIDMYCSAAGSSGTVGYASYSIKYG
jgi:hypothetical protein